MLRRILGQKSGKRRITETLPARKPQFESLERRILMYGAGLLMSSAASGIAPDPIAPEPAADTASEMGDVIANTAETSTPLSVTQAKSSGAALELRLIRRRVLTVNEGTATEAAIAAVTAQADRGQTEAASTALRTASMIVDRASDDAAPEPSISRAILTGGGTADPTLPAETPAVAVEAEDSLSAPANRAAILRQMGQSASNPTVRGESDSEPDVTSTNLATSATPQTVVTIVLRRRAASATPGNNGVSDAGSSTNQSPATSDNAQPGVPTSTSPGVGQSSESDDPTSVGETPVNNSPLTPIPNVLELGADQEPMQTDDDSPNPDDSPEPTDAQPQPSIATIGLSRLLRNQGETGQAQPVPTDVSGPENSASDTPAVAPDELRSLLAAARPSSSLASSTLTPPWSELVDAALADAQADDILPSAGSELRLLWL